ncbi:hypothetical protein PRK78_005274 [Emydomyces testavorans]|uniref:Acyltransferase 3 domain-containing protein n=1 Tax=Emydomyces testavorans TaxID=2070801 RepID=A0AAF0DK74_9EURO|nr:hypothetical protein PRK78_005274 [Emydomyces testavorans]
MRGIASFIVVTGHLCTAFAPILQAPALAADKGPMLFQLPFFRMCVGGRAAVALFFLVTGFVNSMGAMRHFANGNHATALPNLARSAFTRSARLILPTNAAAFTAWLVCQLGGFNLALAADSDWIRSVAKVPSPTAWHAITALFQNMTLFWHNGSGTYDPTHWAIVFFLRGSMRIYLTLLATSLVKTKWRIVIIVLLYLFSWWTGDYIVGINIYYGMFIAQLHTIFGPRATNLLPRPIPALVILIGLFVCCYPQHNPEWMLWSRVMQHTMAAVIPQPTADSINRYWVSIGACILVFGIFTSRNARKILSLPLFNFLGRVSFAVYLLHDTLLRSLLTWMIYGANARKVDLSLLNGTGEPVNLVPAARPAVFAVAVPVFYVVLYAVAYLWTRYVDAWCANAVNWARDVTFKKDEDVMVNGRATSGGGGGGGSVSVTEKAFKDYQPLKNGEGPLLPITNNHVSA